MGWGTRTPTSNDPPPKISQVIHDDSEAEGDRANRSLSIVAGEQMERSIADFTRACEVHILEEQYKPLPDNALIGLICDAVRLAREHVQMTMEMGAEHATVGHLLDAGDDMIAEIDSMAALLVQARNTIKSYIDLHEVQSQRLLMPELIELHRQLVESIEARRQKRIEANAK